MGKRKGPETTGSVNEKANNIGKRIAGILIVLVLAAGLLYALRSCGTIEKHNGQDRSSGISTEQTAGNTHDNPIDENGEYTTAHDVAEYIHTYHKLPSNYVKKGEARSLGWNKGEDPSDYGIMIGGDSWKNREKKLPEDEYYECDVDYSGSRGANRLIYTRKGVVYYTKDHYNSFEQLY